MFKTFLLISVLASLIEHLQLLFWPVVGGVVNKRFGQNRKLPPALARRRGQGVITGLAARKNAALFKGISPLNRPAQNRPAQNRPMPNRPRPNNAAFNQVWKLILHWRVIMGISLEMVKLWA